MISLEIIRFFTHYSMHFLIPLAIALIFFRKNWKKAWLIMILTMLVDLDHLFANPIFDPNRCSIGFHFLHSYFAIFGYFLLLFFKKIRIVGVGLLWHMVTDFVDCFWNF